MDKVWIVVLILLLVVLLTLFGHWWYMRRNTTGGESEAARKRFENEQINEMNELHAGPWGGGREWEGGWEGGSG